MGTVYNILLTPVELEFLNTLGEASRPESIIYKSSNLEIRTVNWKTEKNITNTIVSGKCI